MSEFSRSRLHIASNDGLQTSERAQHYNKTCTSRHSCVIAEKAVIGPDRHCIEALHSICGADSMHHAIPRRQHSE